MDKSWLTFLKYLTKHNINFVRIDFNNRLKIEPKLYELYLVLWSLKKQELKIMNDDDTLKQNFFKNIHEFLIMNNLSNWFEKEVAKIRLMCY